MTDTKPPLPENFIITEVRWTDEQMHQYANAATLAERERCASIAKTTRFTGNVFPVHQMEQLRIDIEAAIRKDQT